LSMTAYGEVLAKLMTEHGISLDELAKLSGEAGYPFTSEVAEGHMRDRHYHLGDRNVVVGPAEVFNLGTEDRVALATAYLFDTIG
jgi:hypothetical protein